MRAILRAVLLVSCTCCAEDANTSLGGNDVHKEVVEQGKGNDAVRVEAVFRGKQLLLRNWSKRNQKGEWRLTSRSLYANGELVAIESDENRDGFFEMLAIFTPGMKGEEVFLRGSDGSLEPVNRETLESFRKGNSALKSAFEKLATQKDSVESNK